MFHQFYHTNYLNIELLHLNYLCYLEINGFRFDFGTFINLIYPYFIIPSIPLRFDLAELELHYPNFHSSHEQFFIPAELQFYFHQILHFLLAYQTHSFVIFSQLVNLIKFN